MSNHDLPCICSGNLRKIIYESHGLLGRNFQHGGDTYTFVGVVCDVDDYYYCMWRGNDMKLLSCVGSLEDHGFTQCEEKKEPNQNIL